MYRVPLIAEGLNHYLNLEMTTFVLYSLSSKLRPFCKV